MREEPPPLEREGGGGTTTLARWAQAWLGREGAACRDRERVVVWEKASTEATFIFSRLAYRKCDK